MPVKNNAPPVGPQLPKRLTENIWAKDGQFWILNGSAPMEFKPLSSAQLFRILKLQLEALKIGLKRKQILDGITWIAYNQTVDQVIPKLAGYEIGIEEINGHQILIPSALKLIEPVHGISPDISLCLISNLLGPAQSPYFYSWLKIFMECLRQGNKRPGQVVIFSGPQGCGKTATQDLIITPLFGGCWADPYRFAIGRTEFNAEQFSAAHWKISDQKNPKNRDDVQEFIRRVASNEDEQLHPKNRQAISVPILRRMTVSCNETEKDLQIVPPLADLTDKLLLFKCEAPPCKFHDETNAGREAFGALIRGLNPALAGWLEDYQIPDQIKDSRYGVVGFQHPELVAKVAQLEPEERLIRLLQAYKQLCFGTHQTTDFIDVTASKLYADLDNQHSLRHELYDICRSPSVLGKLLQKLIDRRDGRFSCRLSNIGNLYTVNL